MLRFFQRFWPSTLRMQLMLILLPVVSVPIIATGYVLQLNLHHAILEEKQNHLQGITALLANNLEIQGGYTQLLSKKNANRQAQIAHLHQALRDYTDRVAASFPGIGVGYYHRTLNAVITYGPDAQYGATVGTSITADHPGWNVMAHGQAMTVSGPQVRGNIMNAMRPIHENGQVVGYIWANELADEIAHQARTMRMTVYGMTLLGLTLALVVVFFMIGQLANGIEIIRQGLYRLRFDLHQSIPPIKGEMGEITHEINALASSLRETRSMHHNILNSLSDAVITVDGDGKVSYINPAACQLLRQDASAMLNQAYLSLFRPDCHFSRLLIDTLREGIEHRDEEIDYPFADRSVRVLASTSLYFDGHGQQLGAIAILRDISETFSLRQQVVRADRLAAIGEMAAGIAHELRTPLTSIRGFVQYLQGSTHPDEWHEYSRIIIREVDGLNRLVSELLDLVRQHALHPHPEDITKLIRDVLLLARDTATDQHVNFRLELAENLALVALDRGQIKQVLLNIIINAMQAINGQGEIHICTQQQAQHIVIIITDTGCGIAPENMERIFDPFFSTKPSGTGLGMAIVRRIMEDHHGEITLTSTVNQGTRVTLRLPMQDIVNKEDEAQQNADQLHECTSFCQNDPEPS